MGFLSFLMLVAIAYLLWRIADQLPDLIFRLSEVQRDVAEVRRRLAAETPSEGAATNQRDGASAANPASSARADAGANAGS
jgi:hypothetical protein